MTAIIVGTHGRFSEELVRSAEMIVGKGRNLAAVTLEPGDSSEVLMEKYKNVLNQLDVKDGVLFLVDLYGGSPFNAASRIAIEHQNMDVITGVNLPMLLETMNRCGAGEREELAELAQAAGHQGITSLKASLARNSNEEEL